MTIRPYEKIPGRILAIQVRDTEDTYGDVLNSGNLEADKHYEVVTTEADHFGAGVVIGDVVTGLTTALDANNTVKEIALEVTLDNGNKVEDVEYGTVVADDYYILETGSGYGDMVAVETFSAKATFEAAYYAVD